MVAHLQCDSRAVLKASRLEAANPRETRLLEGYWSRLYASSRTFRLARFAELARRGRADENTGNERVKDCGQAWRWRSDGARALAAEAYPTRAKTP